MTVRYDPARDDARLARMPEVWEFGSGSAVEEFTPGRYEIWLCWEFVNDREKRAGSELTRLVQPFQFDDPAVASELAGSLQKSLARLHDTAVP